MQLKQYEIVQNKDMLNVDLQQIFMLINVYLREVHR